MKSSEQFNLPLPKIVEGDLLKIFQNLPNKVLQTATEWPTKFERSGEFFKIEVRGGGVTTVLLVDSITLEVTISETESLDTVTGGDGAYDVPTRWLHTQHEINKARAAALEEDLNEYLNPKVIE